MAATIAAIGGADLPGNGRDLRQRAGSERPIQIEFHPDRPKARFFGALAAEPARAVVVGHHKLIEYAGHRELYDLAADPRETVNLSTLQPDLADRLAGFLPASPRQPNIQPPLKTGVTEEQQRQLRALGYIR